MMMRFEVLISDSGGKKFHDEVEVSEFRLLGIVNLLSLILYFKTPDHVVIINLLV